MPIITTPSIITLTAGGGTVNLDIAEPVDIYFIRGTATLTSNWTIQPSNVNSLPLVTGTLYEFKYEADITLDGNTITIFGKTLPPHLADKNMRITAYYNGSAWIVDFIPDFNQTNILLETATLGNNFVIVTPSSPSGLKLNDGVTDAPTLGTGVLGGIRFKIENGNTLYMSGTLTIDVDETTGSGLYDKLFDTNFLFSGYNPYGIIFTKTVGSTITHHTCIFSTGDGSTNPTEKGVWVILEPYVGVDASASYTFYFNHIVRF